jgi:hypothetical protein
MAASKSSAPYPSWGRYTNFGKLAASETLDRAPDQEQRNPGAVEVCIDYGAIFLSPMPDQHLDWIYLDAHHDYRDVKDDLTSILPKMKPASVIMGDDYFMDPASQHAGVKRAVDEFAVVHGLELVFEDQNQFTLRLPQ